ncbi:MAG: RES family NAD+ phosphorylase [Gemmatimonadota bacterium]
MSSSIWMQCEGDSRIGELSLEPWRAVESQHQVATRKLVDSDAEQRVLEELIEGAKPAERAHAHLHYLLFTPFRYPPLRHGSRFGTRTDAGIWYGSETQRTAFAEVAYYRLLFLEGTAADLELVETELTTFTSLVRAQRGVDLQAPPFSSYEREFTSPISYLEAQALGESMREAEVEAFRYRSARDVEGGTNVGVLSPSAFGTREPRQLESWHCSATRSGVELTRRDYFSRGVHTFYRQEFLVGGSLPAPAL